MTADEVVAWELAQHAPSHNLESTQFWDGLNAQWTLRFCWPERPFNMNEWNTMHHRTAATHRKHWRTAFSQMSEGCPRLEYAWVTVEHVCPTRTLADPVACAPAYKAALDGLRDHKDDGVPVVRVLADDNPTYIKGVNFVPPYYVKDVSALIITLVGPAA